MVEEPHFPFVTSALQACILTCRLLHVSSRCVADVMTGFGTCRCFGLMPDVLRGTHSRTNSKDCPLNPMRLRGGAAGSPGTRNHARNAATTDGDSEEFDDYDDEDYVVDMVSDNEEEDEEESDGIVARAEVVACEGVRRLGVAHRGWQGEVVHSDDDGMDAANDDDDDLYEEEEGDEMAVVAESGAVADGNEAVVAESGAMGDEDEGHGGNHLEFDEGVGTDADAEDNGMDPADDDDDDLYEEEEEDEMAVVAESASNDLGPPLPPATCICFAQFPNPRRPQHLRIESPYCPLLPYPEFAEEPCVCFATAEYPAAIQAHSNVNSPHCLFYRGRACGNSTNVSRDTDRLVRRTAAEAAEAASSGAGCTSCGVVGHRNSASAECRHRVSGRIFQPYIQGAPGRLYHDEAPTLSERCPDCKLFPLDHRFAVFMFFLRIPALRSLRRVPSDGDILLLLSLSMTGLVGRKVMCSYSYVYLYLCTWNPLLRQRPTDFGIFLLLFL